MSLTDDDIHKIALSLADELRAPSRLPKFITSRDAASTASVSTRTIRNWVKRGEIRAYWAGNDLRIRLDDLLAYLSRKRPDDVIDVEERARAIMGDHG